MPGRSERSSSSKESKEEVRKAFEVAFGEAMAGKGTLSSGQQALLAICFLVAAIYLFFSGSFWPGIVCLVVLVIILAAGAPAPSKVSEKVTESPEVAARLKPLRKAAEKALYSAGPDRFLEIDIVIAAAIARGSPSKSQIDEVIVDEWVDLLGSLPDTEPADEPTLRMILEYKNHFSIAESEWQKGLMRFLKIAALTNALSRTDIVNVTITDELNITLRPDETVLYCFHNTQLVQDVTTKEYVGSSAGVSFRVAKGLYLRTGAHKGTPVSRTELRTADHGRLVTTNKALVFVGQHKSFRIPYERIISFREVDAGIVIMPDGKPRHCFLTNDGPFTWRFIPALIRKHGLSKTR